MLARLARFLHRQRRRVLIVTAVAAVIAGALGFGVSKYLSPYGATDPASQSVKATNRFEAATHRQLDPSVVVLFRSGSLQTAGARDSLTQLATRLRREPNVVSVLDYLTTRDPAMVSTDGRSTYLLAYFRPLSDKAGQDAAQRIESDFAHDPRVSLGGFAVASDQINKQVSHDLGHAELLAFPVIVLLSLLFFRSAVAALMPPLLGGLAIVVTMFMLRVVSSFVDMSVFALNFVTGMGLGLAIDYSLFMVSRYREEAALSGFGADALVRTLQTAGRTILFSSVTIAAAIASLIVFPQRFLYSMGIAGALTALIAAALALTVLPALLALLGPRINALAPARLQRAAAREARPAHQGAWYRLSQLVMRRPVAIALACAAVLIAVGIPFTHIRLIQADERVLPPTAGAHQVFTELGQHFPPGRTNPVQVILGAPASSPRVAALRSQIARLPGASAVSPARSAGPADSILSVAPSHEPLSPASQNLVARIRSLHPPFYLGVAGETAAFVDLKHSLAVHLPAVLAIVVSVTLLVLFVMTGSVVLPIKAVLMNVLTLSAMFGILVLIFQDGNLQSLLSFHSLGALDATQPIFLFAVGFGLATDYGVFLLSRIKEAHDGGLSNDEAVAMGLERTGRIVTAAAILFAVAIGAFATSEIVFIKELGIGAALAVLIDATIIRALLVPSLMKLLGDANWWAPASLRRLHERIGLGESQPDPVAADRAQAAAPAAAPSTIRAT